MPRNDLLSLSHDDLAALTNRGTVKRALRELEDGTLSCTFIDHDILTIDWSDGTRCTFPAGKALHEAVCSSGVIGISRHVVRSVLAYQSKESPEEQPTDLQGTSSETTTLTSTNVATKTAWDPGDINDADLIAQFNSAAVTRARKIFDQGVLVDLTRGVKPTACFLHESCTVRFPVPHDIRYAIADCSTAALPQWVALAVWSFRQLPADRKAGLVALGQSNQAIPSAEIAHLHTLLQQWFAEGFAGLAPTWPQRFARLEAELRAAGMIWPAELMQEIITQQRRYSEHDARFSASETLRSLGELIARLRVIRNRTPTLPLALVCGNKADRRTDIKASRFIGLGMQVRPLQKQTKLLSYFQDNNSGKLVAITRTLSDPENVDELASFETLAVHSLARGVSIGAAATSQLVLGSGKRTASDELILPRAGPTGNKLTIHPQSFQWEHLQPPLALDDFGQCQQRLAQLPPDYLRPKRCTENLQVFPISAITEVQFDSIHQHLIATIYDTTGTTATLSLPYYTRAEAAFDHFSHTLQTQGDVACFISGHVRLKHKRLEIEPLAVIIQTSDGQRMCVTPWICNHNISSFTSAPAIFKGAAVESSTYEFFSELQTQLAEILITGLNDANTTTLRQLIDSAYRVGFSRLTIPLETLVKELEERLEKRNWLPTLASFTYAQLALLNRMID